MLNTQSEEMTDKINKISDFIESVHLENKCEKQHKSPLRPGTADVVGTQR